MIELEPWLNAYMQALRETFGERVWFAGLQGSYAREEATESSDIDMVVILDALAAEDIASYGAMLDSLDHRELVCGFLSGKEELLHWEPSELFQFCRDTRPVIGSLDEILASVDAGDVDRAIRAGVCGVYHACVHNMLYEKDMDILRESYKAASFAIRAAVWRHTGKYCGRLDELLRCAGDSDREIIRACIALRDNEIISFSDASGMLFAWAKERIIRMPAPHSS